MDEGRGQSIAVFVLNQGGFKCRLIRSWIEVGSVFVDIVKIN